MDVLCLLPLDVLYFVFGSGYLIFRLPRLLKVINNIGSFDSLYAKDAIKITEVYT